MVSIADVQNISLLYAERRRLNEAISEFDRGEKISSLNVGRAMVDTRGMDYPQQMVDAIKASVQQRITAVEDELKSLGVTELPADEPER